MKHHFYEHYTLATLRQRGFNATLVDFKYSEYGILIEETGCNFCRLQVKPSIREESTYADISKIYRSILV
ncbi:MAG: hypothetical protein F4039_10510 [Gammaproteobacteria bacterium]|nr:hypothetical protein [Gammaproteobacteria bacterium]MYK44499.1 hypothetical protein [Gammaproteobacteria bacterium]